jgi:thymidylate synthase
VAKLFIAKTFGELYLKLLQNLLWDGAEVKINRTGQLTKELLGVTLHVEDARSNVLVHPARGLNYRFLVAEWLWIMAGREDVGSISYYNSKIAWYSDDGKTFAGAYGPRLELQFDYLIRTLKEDPSSRQAVATIWTPNPAVTRDTPCTLHLQLILRDGKLHGIFSMRSSDAWKGVCYDTFNFSQLLNHYAGELDAETGSMTLHLGSSHLYEEEWKLAETVVAKPEAIETLHSPQLNNHGTGRGMANLALWTRHEFQEDKENEPWLTYFKVLRSETSSLALTHLRRLHESSL